MVGKPGWGDEENRRFREVAREIVPHRQGEATDLAAVMDWVNHHMTYDHAAASLKADAVHALKDCKGHCSDYHGLCAAVGRALMPFPAARMVPLSGRLDGCNEYNPARIW